MFRKQFYILISLTSLLFCSYSYSGWDNDYNIYTHVHKGVTIVKALNIPNESQPNTYTCGATNIKSIVRWKTLYEENNPIKYTINSIYNYINTNGSDGIQIPELKSGFSNLITYTNNTEGMNISTHTTEIKGNNISDAIYGFYNINLLATNSPAILYGNVKYGSAGGHYYMAIGGVNCDENVCGFRLKGLYLNDSVYDSKAYDSDSIFRKNAIRPWQLISEDELETYWKKTGSRLPWEKTHNMLIFP